MKFTGADTANELFSAHEIGDDADSVFFNVSRGGEVGKEGPEREGEIIEEALSVSVVIADVEI